MPYVGKEPVRGQNRELDDISGSFNGGNTAFTMQVGGINTAAGSANQVFINLGGVMQNPGTDFTVASSTITFTTPPANGLSFWGLIQGDAVDINEPADGSVTNAKIATGAAIAGSKLADNAVGLAQMAGGTDGNLITYDASGDPAHVATGSSGEVLTSNGAGAAPTFQATSSAGSTHNLIINGSMKVAQYGTSDTTDVQGRTTVDRWSVVWNLLEEQISRYQEQLTSSDAGPWELGFRNAWKIQNGNQTGGADAGGYINPQYAVEAQDLANSGWNYTSASSYITLSFWVKSSVSQTFYGYLRTLDGTNQAYSFSYSASSTWTKVTKTIPGNSNIQVDNDTGSGLYLYLPLFFGTDRTDAGNTENTWAAYNGSNRTKPSTTTWYTTDDATWHITGVQLEVGNSATTFEHRSFGDELARCQRYYWQEAQNYYGTAYTSAHRVVEISHPVPMRAIPTETLSETTGSGSFTAFSETNMSFRSWIGSAYNDGDPDYYSLVKFSAEI